VTGSECPVAKEELIDHAVRGRTISAAVKVSGSIDIEAAACEQGKD